MRIALLVPCLTLAIASCGGSASYSTGYAEEASWGGGGDVAESAPMAPADSYYDDYGYDFEDDYVDAEYMMADATAGYATETQSYGSEESLSRSDGGSGDGGGGGLFGGERRRDSSDVAQAGPAPDPEPTPVDDTAPPAPEDDAVGGVDDDEEEAEDDRRTPLLIYNGSVTLAVYEVEENQEAAIVIVEEFGGYASERTSMSITFRVPAEYFRDVLDAFEGLGDVLNLTWSAQDVTEQFMDLEIRLRNSLEMRERLEVLLAQATTVQDALAIEQQLERITLQIEQYRGQLRYLADRIGYSTITLNFSPIPVTQVPGEEYRLPFDWLNGLGLERLLSL